MPTSSAILVMHTTTPKVTGPVPAALRVTVSINDSNPRNATAQKMVVKGKYLGSRGKQRRKTGPYCVTIRKSDLRPDRQRQESLS